MNVKCPCNDRAIAWAGRRRPLEPRSDEIGTGLQVFGLTRFLDANRSPPRIKSGAGFRWKTL
ncbi:MAG TPA: hypothetical protein VMT08_02390, partial [Bradyrhizobium sp.]|nr:hypothetical protein [Bradyrhizobium sp.]